MRSPYGLKVIESCLSCPVRRDRLLCDVSPEALRALDTITVPAVYPKGALLFVEGQLPRGVFVLCAGRVKLSASSPEGKTLIMRIAEAGEIVGLPGTISGRPYELSAETLEPAQANFIARDQFLRFLGEHGEVALRVAKVLSNIYYSAYDEIRTLGLSRSSSEKLARFLLDWSARPTGTRRDGRVTLALTHEEIAQTIGASRETVTRLLTELRKKRIVQLKGATLTIRNRTSLEKLAAQSSPLAVLPNL